MEPLLLIQWPAESVIKFYWLNTWLWGFLGIICYSVLFNKLFFFFPPIGFLDSDPPPGNREDNEDGSWLLAEEVTTVMTCNGWRWTQEDRVAMESGIWVKTFVLKCSFSIRLFKMFKTACPGGFKGIFFPFSDHKCCSLIYSMFRLPHRLLTLLARFVNMLWASHSRRCVLSAVRGWYAKRWQAQSWFPATCWRIFVFESTGFRRAQKQGSSVSACKVTCQGARPAMKPAHL